MCVECLSPQRVREACKPPISAMCVSTVGPGTLPFAPYVRYIRYLSTAVRLPWYGRRKVLKIDSFGVAAMREMCIILNQALRPLFRFRGKPALRPIRHIGIMGGHQRSQAARRRSAIWLATGSAPTASTSPLVLRHGRVRPRLPRAPRRSVPSVPSARSRSAARIGTLFGAAAATSRVAAATPPSRKLRPAGGVSCIWSVESRRRRATQQKAGRRWSRCERSARHTNIEAGLKRDISSPACSSTPAARAASPRSSPRRGKVPCGAACFGWRH